MYDQAIAFLRTQVSEHERRAQYHHDRVDELHAAIKQLEGARAAQRP